MTFSASTASVAGRYPRYAPDMVQLIATLRAARCACFTVSEIRTLGHGFGVDVPPAARWLLTLAHSAPGATADGSALPAKA